MLLNTDGRPVAVVEAKKEVTDPLSAKEQARAYAAGLGVSHIFHALVLDGQLRAFVERGEFAQLRSLDAGLYHAIRTVGPDGVKGLVAHVRRHVALDDFVRVA